MSTNAIIAEVGSGGVWRGRHSHWDGYPTHSGKQLWDIAHREGVTGAKVNMIWKRFGWSTLSADQPSIEGVAPDPNAAYGTPEYVASTFASIYSDGRFENVPGFGVAYTADSGQTNADEWYTEADAAASGHEWAYVLDENDMKVYRLDDTPVLLGEFPWTANEPDWKALEESF